jgi:hypothetical protein
MTLHRRAVLLALLALAVPLPALALTGGDSDDATPFTTLDLAVSASLDSCGTTSSTIVCKIDASWSSAPGADRYTATVTRPDGSVIDYGEVGAGSASFWIPYVGNGTYSVQVSAYGTPPRSDEPEVIAKGTSNTGDRSSQEFGAGTAAGTPGEEPTTTGEPVDPEAEDPGETPPGTDPEEPLCEEPTEPPAEPPVTESPAETNESSAGVLESEAAADADAEELGPVECPDPPLEG